MAGKGSDTKKGGKKKTWFEIYWPDATNSHGNGTKVGRLHSRRVASKQDGKTLYSLLLEKQELFERTGFEDPILGGMGVYVSEMNKRQKQHST